MPPILLQERKASRVYACFKQTAWPNEGLLVPPQRTRVPVRIVTDSITKLLGDEVYRSHWLRLAKPAKSRSFRQSIGQGALICTAATVVGERQRHSSRFADRISHGRQQERAAHHLLRSCGPTVVEGSNTPEVTGLWLHVGKVPSPAYANSSLVNPTFSQSVHHRCFALRQHSDSSLAS